MEKIGIICEYNPFHNGHIYHIKKIKEMFPNSFITLILSASFTQRGEFSFLTKWEKTKIALEENIDLVIELPFLFTTQSADTFAHYALTYLEYLDMDYFVFGSESDDVDVLKNLASTILYHKEYDFLVKNYLQLGNSYPSSMSKALYNLTGVKIKDSNDLLGLSYIKTIMKYHYKIKPLTIKRTNIYLNQELTPSISSATSIRKAYLENKDIKNYVPLNTLAYLQMPKEYLNNYFYLLKYKLINEINDLDNYLDVCEGIDKKIKKEILKVNTYEELLENIKSKRFTYNKLNRMFLHILMNVKKEESNQPIRYIRVLGFNQKGRAYLKAIKKKLSIPIITNYKDIDDFVLKLELKVTMLYLHILKKEELIKEELKSIPIQKDC